MIEKWNKIQSLEKDAYIYLELSLKMMLGQSMGNGKLFDNIYMSKKQTSNLTSKRMKHQLKINRRLKCKNETIKGLEEEKILVMYDK